MRKLGTKFVPSEAVEWLEENCIRLDGIFEHGQAHRQGLFQIESAVAGGTCEAIWWDYIPGTSEYLRGAKPSEYREMQYTSEILGIADIAPWADPDHWRDVVPLESSSCESLSEATQ